MTKLHLFIRAEKLPTSRISSSSRRITKKLNAHAVVSDLSNIGGVLGIRKKEIGRTEIVPSTSHPEYAQIIFLHHEDTDERTTPRRIGIDIYHSNQVANVSSVTSSKYRYDEFKDEKPICIGGGCFEINDLVRTNNENELCVPMTGTSGKIYVSYEPSAGESPSLLTFKLRGCDLANTRVSSLVGKVGGMTGGLIDTSNLSSVLNRPNFYYEVSRKVPRSTGDTWGLVFRSERAKDTLNPMWDECTLDLERVCNNNIDRTVRVHIYDYQDGSRNVLGYFETTVRRLIDAKSDRGNYDMDKAFDVILHKSGGSKVKRRGKVVVVAASMQHHGHERSYSESAVLVGGGSTSMATANAGGHKRNASVAASYTGGGATRSSFGTSPYDSRRVSGTAAPSPLRHSSTDSSDVQVAQKVADMSLSCSIGPASALPYAVAEPTKRPTFEEYIRGGCELEMCVAIDFTRTNGDHKAPRTPHFIYDRDKLNDYEWAMSVVGTIVGKYCSTAEPNVRVWGFGASFNEKTYHLFQCGTAKTAKGVRGVLDAYRKTFNTGLAFSEPTVYSEVVHAATSHALKAKRAADTIGKFSYTILLVLTTGNAQDVEAARSQLEKTSRAPISVIFVRIPTTSANGSSRSSLEPCQDFLAGCRSFVTFADCPAYSSRNSQSFAHEAFYGRLPDQVVNYFVTQGVYPD